MEFEKLSSALESILFAADRPLSIDRVQEVFGEQSPSPEDIKEVLGQIRTKYLEGNYGFELREALGGYQFCTKPDNAEWVRRYLQTKPFRLGRSALEVMAIVAYRQPITRAEIDQVRGIDSSHLLRTLIERGIVKMAGKAEVPGRPVQYGTTPKFLELVGLNSLSELPPLSELEKLEGHSQPTQLPSLEDGLDAIMATTDQEVEESGAQDKAMLSDIETLIETAQGAGKEVFESREHAEVSKENELAQKEWQAFSRALLRNARRYNHPEEFATEESVEEKIEAPADLNLVDVPQPMQAGTEISDGEPEEEEKPRGTILDAIKGDILPGPPKSTGDDTPDPILN